MSNKLKMMIIESVREKLSEEGTSLGQIASFKPGTKEFSARKKTDDEIEKMRRALYPDEEEQEEKLEKDKK